MKFKILGNLYLPLWTWYQYLKPFWCNRWLWLWPRVQCHHLEDLCILVNQCFVSNLCRCYKIMHGYKISFAMQDKAVDFDGHSMKSSLIGFQKVHCLWSLRNYHLLSVGIVSKKSIYNYLKNYFSLSNYISYFALSNYISL